MRRMFLIFLAAGCLFTACSSNAEERCLFTVTRNNEGRHAGDRMSIVLDWREFVRRFPVGENGHVQIRDLNFGKQANAYLLDEDDNKVIDKVVIDFVFDSAEPVYTFSIETAKEKLTVIKKHEPVKSEVTVTYLTAFDNFKRAVPVAFPDQIIESTLSFYPDPSLLSINAPGQWNYEYGFFLSAMLDEARQTKNERYFQYVKKWADKFVDNSGRIDPSQYKPEEYKLDDILPGRLLISLYAATNDQWYQRAADGLAEQLQRQPKTSEGGYWHKKIYPQQMWLDGIYMADVFSAQYAQAFQRPEFFDEAVHQILLVAKHTTDPSTGLMYHGWDESLNKVWANPRTGTSPEFWGRSQGWYAMALAECLSYLPKEHPKRMEVVTVFQRLLKSILKYQDKESGLWFQVIDKAKTPGNWVETSCSAMFAYAMMKGYKDELLPKEYEQAALKAFQQLKKEYVFFDDSGRLYLTGTVKVGTLNPKTSKADFSYYTSTERRINDYKGLGALLYLSLICPR